MRNEIIEIEIRQNDTDSLLPLLERIETRITTSYNTLTDTLDTLDTPPQDLLNTHDELRETQELIWTLQHFIQTSQQKLSLTYLSLD